MRPSLCCPLLHSAKLRVQMTIAERTKPTDPLSPIERRRKISAEEAARLRGVSKATFLRMVARGEIRQYDLSPRRKGYELGEILDA